MWLKSHASLDDFQIEESVDRSFDDVLWFWVVYGLGEFIPVEFGLAEKLENCEFSGLVAYLPSNDILEVLLEQTIWALVNGLRFLWGAIENLQMLLGQGYYLVE